MEFTAEQIASLIEGKIEGDPKALVRDVSKIEEGRPQTLSFLSNPKYEQYIYTTQASVVIVNDDFKPEQALSATLIRVPDAYRALAKLLQFYQEAQPKKTGIEQPSFIAKSATLGDFAYVGAFAYIGEGVKIRSEEHTSELQSRPHLVCRLLLEKKKKKIKSINH